MNLLANMILTIIIFFVAIGTAFGVLLFRAWEIRSGRANISLAGASPLPEISFRKLEKNMLYFAKRFIQVTIIGSAKYWFLTTIKMKKWVIENWPKVHIKIQKIFEDKPKLLNKKPTFIGHILIESKVKIKRIKQKILEDHDM